MQWPCLKLRVVCSMHPASPVSAPGMGGVGREAEEAGRETLGEGAPAIHVTLLQAWCRVSFQKTQVIQ